MLVWMMKREKKRREESKKRREHSRRHVSTVRSGNSLPGAAARSLGTARARLLARWQPLTNLNPTNSDTHTTLAISIH